MLYRSLRSQQEIDREYNPRLTLGEDAANAYLASYKEESRRVRETLAVRLDVPYGPSPAETLDIFPAPEHGGPIHVFIHGGTGGPSPRRISRSSPRRPSRTAPRPWS